MRVLFISKPVVPPFHDGTKCLVRDVAEFVTEVTPIVLSSRGAPPWDGSARTVEQVPIYASAGSYTPALAQNVRAAAWVLLRSRADVWHFVFAPNARTSQVGSVLRAARRVPVVQTIASPPRAFDDVDRLLFGDVVVAQSRWTRERVLETYAGKGKAAPALRVIPPPVRTDLTRSPERVSQARKNLDVPPDAPLFVYPGDLEVSSGARVTLELSRRLAATVPGAITVFAYREKTPETAAVASRLRAQADPAITRWVSTLPDVLELIAGATALLFPVDDLWGKVDLPIVLLEAMVLGVPVVAYDSGPLRDLDFARLVPSLAIDDWVSALVELAGSAQATRELVERQRRGVHERHAADVVARAYEALYVDLGARASKSGDR